MDDFTLKTVRVREIRDTRISDNHCPPLAVTSPTCQCYMGILSYLANVTTFFLSAHLNDTGIFSKAVVADHLV